MRFLKASFIISLFLILAFKNNLAQDMSEMQAKVDQWNKDICKAMLANDQESILNFYADDVISLPSYAQMIMGKDNLKEAMMKQDTMSSKMTDFNLVSKKLIMNGDLLLDVGTYDLTMNIQGMDEPVMDHGKYLTVYEKQNDNSWKIKVETWNSDINPWMSKGEDMD